MENFFFEEIKKKWTTSGTGPIIHACTEGKLYLSSASPPRWAAQADAPQHRRWAFLRLPVATPLLARMAAAGPPFLIVFAWRARSCGIEGSRRALGCSDSGGPRSGDSMLGSGCSGCGSAQAAALASGLCYIGSTRGGEVAALGGGAAGRWCSGGKGWCLLLCCSWSRWMLTGGPFSALGHDDDGARWGGHPGEWRRLAGHACDH